VEKEDGPSTSGKNTTTSAPRVNQNHKLKESKNNSIVEKGIYHLLANPLIWIKLQSLKHK
ncbi:MAG: hypothetical protein AAFY71_28675, partial [Bacteroidota bacterium]